MEALKRQYDAMQLQYGAPELRSIYFGGCCERPTACFVFMNPTGRNIASAPEWPGMRAPWIGTKTIWDLFRAVELLDEGLYREIKARKTGDWSVEFAAAVYEDLRRRGVYVTNLAKCTQTDARPLPDRVYRQYLPLVEQELALVDPKRIILLGNQVSSVFLGRPMSVSQCRRTRFDRILGGRTYPCYPVYYPVGNGRANIGKAIEDIRWILEQGRGEQELRQEQYP